MSPRTGRPKSENAKRNDCKVRVDDETMQRLNRYCTDHGITKAEAIRKGIILLLEKE